MESREVTSCSMSLPWTNLIAEKVGTCPTEDCVTYCSVTTSGFLLLVLLFVLIGWPTYRVLKGYITLGFQCLHRPPHATLQIHCTVAQEWLRGAIVYKSRSLTDQWRATSTSVLRHSLLTQLSSPVNSMHSCISSYIHW